MAWFITSVFFFVMAIVLWWDQVRDVRLFIVFGWICSMFFFDGARFQRWLDK